MQGSDWMREIGQWCRFALWRKRATSDNNVTLWRGNAPKKTAAAIRCFAHDTKRILATVYGLALVGIELTLNVGTFELTAAPFADADGRRVCTIGSLLFCI